MNIKQNLSLQRLTQKIYERNLNFQNVLISHPTAEMWFHSHKKTAFFLTPIFVKTKNAWSHFMLTDLLYQISPKSDNKCGDKRSYVPKCFHYSVLTKFSVTQHTNVKISMNKFLWKSSESNCIQIWRKIEKLGVKYSFCCTDYQETHYSYVALSAYITLSRILSKSTNKYMTNCLTPLSNVWLPQSWSS